MIKIKFIKDRKKVKAGEILEASRKSAETYIKGGWAIELKDKEINLNQKAKESGGRSEKNFFIKKDVEKFIDYLGHQNYWFNVFKPKINGESPGGLLSNAFFKKKDKDILIKRIEEYNTKGIVCLAVNDRKEKDQTIKTINTVHSLVIDIDVKKSFKKGHVSLPEHHEKALETANNIKTFVEDKGFKVSMIVDSGNGAQMYLYICEDFTTEYKEKRKELIKTQKDSQKIEKELRALFKEQDLTRRIESFEKDLKNNFSQDFIEIDNITKDINRRMKIPGTLNKKDVHQVEDRIAKIIYYKEDCHHDDRDNYIALSNYEMMPVKIIVSEENKPKVSGDDAWTLKRLNSYLKSRKEKDIEFKSTFNAKNLDSNFAGDRSSAEQSIVNMLYFRGFRTFEEMLICMGQCKIGKWQEQGDQYKQLTFEKAQELYNNKLSERKNKKQNFESNFTKYDIYLISDEVKTKYIVHNNENGDYKIKQGNESLIEYLYILLQQEKVDLNQLSLYYPESKSKPKVLLLDFIQDSGLIKIVDDIGFKPVECLTYKDEGKEYYNTYRPTQYLSITKNDEKIDLEKQCKCINDLILNVCGNDKKGREYFLKLLAFILQNPHIRTDKLVVLFGEEGSGKGITFNKIIKVLFEKYAKTANQRDLDSPYNEYLSKKLIVYYNEVESKKENENILKNYVTEPTVSINAKYGGQWTEKSYFTIFADVNGNNPITAGERRTVYFKSKTLGGSFKKSRQLGEYYINEIPKELPIFAQYLKNLEVSHSEIIDGYDTIAKKDVLDNIKTVDKQFIDMMDEYTSLQNFVDALFETGVGLNIGKYIKGDWIELNFLLACFNRFRLMKGMKNPIVLNKFSWIYDSLEIDREDTNQLKRSANTDGRKVRWIRLDKLQERFKDEETIDNIVLENS